jgi:short subunit dehydrogenase-like uncharacterized protein
VSDSLFKTVKSSVDHTVAEGGRGFITNREFDVVLCGAAGFVGRQTVAYFARHAPRDLRWAIAGRSLNKLESLQSNTPAIVFDSLNQREVDALVARTRIILSTAGPFRIYSDPLVNACVRIGTHYVDISGETSRIRDLIDRYHDAAVNARVRIVPFCGFSSTPADLAVYLLERRIGGQLVKANGFYQLGGGSFSGGTIASIANAYTTGEAERERDPFLLNPDHRRVAHSIEKDPKGVRYNRMIRAWTSPSPMGVSDTRAVRRSGSLLGNEIIYQEYMEYPGLSGAFKALGFHAVINLINWMMRFEASRRFLQKTIPPGSGPNERAMDDGSFELRVIGSNGAGKQEEILLRGKGDAGNRITTKCVCEAALAAALNEASLPDVYGVLTPSVAFGEVLVRRLESVGIEIKTRVVSI